MKNVAGGKQKLSEKTWFIVLWLIVFFPVGLFFMWKSTWNKIVKIVISALFAIVIIGSIVSPSKTSDAPIATTDAETTAAVANTEKALENNPLLTYSIKEADVKNGTGTEVIGKWASIEISKKELQGISQENFIDFVNSKIDGSGYNWFTLILDDGTGLQFRGSIKQIGTYGKIDKDGCVTESIGNILLSSDNTYEYSNAETSSEATESVDSETTAKSSTESESVPTEYKSALNKAKTYSDMMSMSKAGIYDQLASEYGEKFSPEAAQYAIDNVGADWNKNALAKAKTYSDTMSMSKLGVYDQLSSDYGEKFTAEEAQYAIDNVVADWNANALEKAKTYQDTMSMSPEAIHDQLTSDYGEKFTQEEADYAIANLN